VRIRKLADKKDRRKYFEKTISRLLFKRDKRTADYPCATPAFAEPHGVARSISSRTDGGPVVSFPGRHEKPKIFDDIPA
jgi:hypothetical protein